MQKLNPAALEPLYKALKRIRERPKPRRAEVKR
jgi:hypothetical protein